MGLSAAVHLGLVALVVWSGSQLVVADRMPGPGNGRGRPGGGGGGNRALLLFAAPAPAAAAPAPVPPPLVMQRAAPVPLPAPAVKPPPQTLPDPTVNTAQLVAGLGPGLGAGQGTGTGPGAGAGSGGGTGAGTGTGSDSGGGGRVYPPFLQGMIIPPPHAPSSVRGTYTARFEISSRGEVMRVSLDPLPPDRKYADELLDRLRHYTFTPAHTLDGRPVAAIYQITITL